VPQTPFVLLAENRPRNFLYLHLLSSRVTVGLKTVTLKEGRTPMSYSNHRQVAGYLRDTRNVSGYLRDTRNVSGYLRSNASIRYLVKTRSELDPTGKERRKYGVFDMGEDGAESIFIAEYFEKVNADAVAKKLNDDDDTLGSFLDLAERIITSDLGQGLIADQLGVSLTGKDKEIAESNSGELDALKKELEEKDAKKKKTTRNLMIGGGVLAAGGLTYLALRTRN
jgi:hypothetical protein